MSEEVTGNWWDTNVWTKLTIRRQANEHRMDQLFRRNDYSITTPIPCNTSSCLPTPGGSNRAVYWRWQPEALRYVMFIRTRRHVWRHYSSSSESRGNWEEEASVSCLGRNQWIIITRPYITWRAVNSTWGDNQRTFSQFVFHACAKWHPAKNVNFPSAKATKAQEQRCSGERMHAGWWHLIWHNFVTVGDNWIKLCNLA